MPLMAFAGLPPFLSLSAPRHRRSLLICACSSSTSITSTSSSADFHYDLADPAVRWPDLVLPDFSKPNFPSKIPLSDDFAPQFDPQPDPEPDPPKTVNTAPLLTLERKNSRSRAKKMTKLALKRAKDWRQRVQFLTDRILSLPPSALVADVLDSPEVQMTPTDYAFVVKAVGQSNWSRALEVFEWLTLRRRHAPVPRLLASIISVLGRANQEGLAAEVFERCTADNSDAEASVQVYNAMMGVYSRSGKFAEVHALLGTMRDKGLEPDLVSFNTLINARAKAGPLPPGDALELLREVRQSGLRPDAITYNTLISACSQGSNLEDAVAIFLDMQTSQCEPDLWTYNAMISVFGRCGMAHEAESLFHELGERGFSPDAVTYNSLVYAFAKNGDVENVEKVCEEMVASGFKKDEITYNTIIHMYGKQGKLELAVKFYDEMRTAGRKPDAVTYTVLIDSLGKAGQIAEAGRVMSGMIDGGVRPTLRTFSALICGYAKAGMRVEAEQMFDHMMKSGIKPDHLAYSVMLDIFVRSDDTKKAMMMYRIMRQDGFKPDDGLYQVFLGLLARVGDKVKMGEIMKDMEEVLMMSSQKICKVLVKGECFNEGVEIIKKAASQGYEPDRENLFPILDAYVDAGKHDEALNFLEFIREQAPSSQNLVIEAAIIIMCKSKQFEAAMVEYNKMNSLNFGHFSRNCNLYEHMITYLEEAGMFCEASQLFSDMKFLGIEPSQTIFWKLINIYCNMGFPESAHHLLTQAENQNSCFADISVYVTLIETYGKLKLWQRAESFVGELRVQKSILDKKIWNALINAYAESGLYEQARSVFNMMVKNGPSPTVDSVNGLMHALIVDGRLDELFVVVQELQDMDLKISKSSIVLMLDAFARAGNIFEVKKIYNGMKAAGYLPNMHLYRSMITLLSCGKRVRDVESMVTEMEEAGFKPDLVIYNALLKMYTKIEDFKKTMEVYQNIKGAGFEADEDTYNTLIVMYSRDMRPEEGFTVLNEMSKRGLEPKLYTYKSLLAACGKMLLWEQADELFGSLRSKGYSLDRSFYHIMMKIYRNSGEHSKAEHLLFLMEADGVKPTISTMHLLLVSYGSAGQPKDAEKVLNNLKTSGQDLTTLPYCSVIDAYLKVGDYEMGIRKLLEMKNDGLELDHKIWTCFIRAASLCDRTSESLLLLNTLEKAGFNLPIRLLHEKPESLVMEVDRVLDDLVLLEDNASLNFVNALEDLFWAFERRATASWMFQLAIKRNIYRQNLFRVAEKDWGADFRKLSAGAALVGLTLWLDHMQDASLQGSPESPKSVVIITGTAEYNMVSLNNTIKAFLWEMGSPFLPCKTRSGVLVAKAHSLRMWLKDSSFCMDLELKDARSLPEKNSMKLIDGYFMRAGLVPAFQDIHERLGQVRAKKFARLALLSEESRDKVIKADIEGRKEKLLKMKEKGAVRARKPTRLRDAKFVRRKHQTT